MRTLIDVLLEMLNPDCKCDFNTLDNMKRLAMRNEVIRLLNIEAKLKKIERILSDEQS